MYKKIFQFYVIIFPRYLPCSSKFSRFSNFVKKKLSIYLYFLLKNWQNYLRKVSSNRGRKIRKPRDWRKMWKSASSLPPVGARNQSRLFLMCWTEKYPRSWSTGACPPPLQLEYIPAGERAYSHPPCCLGSSRLRYVIPSIRTHPSSIFPSTRETSASRGLAALSNHWCNAHTSLPRNTSSFSLPSTAQSCGSSTTSVKNHRDIFLFFFYFSPLKLLF